MLVYLTECQSNNSCWTLRTYAKHEIWVGSCKHESGNDSGLVFGIVLRVSCVLAPSLFVRLSFVLQGSTFFFPDCHPRKPVMDRVNGV